MIVDFIERNEVDIVPDNWISTNRTRCYWPSYKTSGRIKQAVIAREEPDDNYTAYKCKVIYHSGKNFTFSYNVKIR